MTEPILINETCETINKLSKEGKKLPIVIINNKRYAEYYNGAYYMSLEEKNKIGERFTGTGMEIVEDYIYRIYKINPKTNKLEMGGYIQYVENLDRSNPKDTCWIGENVKVFNKVIIYNNLKINDNVSFFSQKEVNSYLKKQNNGLKLLNENFDDVINTVNETINQGQGKSIPKI